MFSKLFSLGRLALSTLEVLTKVTKALELKKLYEQFLPKTTKSVET